MYKRQLLLYAAVEDLPARRPAGEGLNVDGREYIVNDWSEDMGIATVADVYKRQLLLREERRGLA